MKKLIIGISIIIVTLSLSGCGATYQKSVFPEFTSTIYPTPNNVVPLTSDYTIPELNSGEYKNQISTTMSVSLKGRSVYAESEASGNLKITVTEDEYIQDAEGDVTYKSNRQSKQGKVFIHSLHDKAGNEIKTDVKMTGDFTLEEQKSFKVLNEQMVKRLFANINRTVKMDDIINDGLFQMSGGKESLSTKEVIVGKSIYQGKEVIVTTIEGEEYGKRSQGITMDAKTKGFRYYDKSSFIPLYSEVKVYMNMFHPSMGTMEMVIGYKELQERK